MDLSLDVVSALSSWLVALATVALVIITGIYARLTNKILQDQRDRVLPSVGLDIELIDQSSVVLLVLTNHGPTPALDLNFTITSNLTWEFGPLAREPETYSLTRRGLKYLAAKRTLKYFLGLTRRRHIEEGKSNITVICEYKNLQGRSLSSELEIDLVELDGTYLPELRSPLDRIAKALNDLENTEKQRLIRESSLTDDIFKKNCAFCKERIQLNATKCRYCHGIQDLERSETNDEEPHSVMPSIRKTIFGRLVRAFKRQHRQ
jgi:hypothetical protein